MSTKRVAHFPSYKLGTMKKKFVEPGRNSPCVCGSGRKYKHCCLAKVNAPVLKAVADANKKNQEVTK